MASFDIQRIDTTYKRGDIVDVYSDEVGKEMKWRTILAVDDLSVDEAKKLKQEYAYDESHVDNYRRKFYIPKLLMDKWFPDGVSRKELSKNEALTLFKGIIDRDTNEEINNKVTEYLTGG